MKTVKEMLDDVRADQAQRQQLEQEQEQKKRDYQEAVALAEKEMQEALARQDQEAYHAAEGRLSYAREVLRTYEAANPWWTPKEAREIVTAAFNAYAIESKEKYQRVFDLLNEANTVLADIYRAGRNGSAIENIINAKANTHFSNGYMVSIQSVPEDFFNKIAMMAGRL